MKSQKAEKIVLEAAVRSSAAKVAAVRREGLVPAVVYKEGQGAVSIQVSARDVSRILHTKAGENALISLHFGPDSKDGLKDHPALANGENVVLIKEIQHHPVTRQLVHLDFHQISLTKKITVSVPLTMQGEAVGVKINGGVLEHMRWEIEVECLPTEIPTEVQVDISKLDKGQTLHVSDIPLPEGVRSVTDLQQPIVACVEPQAETAPAPAEEGAATEPEVIKQKKPEEEGAAAAEGGKEKPKAEAKAEPKAEAKKG